MDAEALDVWAASPVDAASMYGLGIHFWHMLSDADHLVSLPVTPLVYQDAEFRFEGALDARRANVLAEFGELVNRVPTHPLWRPPATVHLWDVYGEVLGADLARSALTADERARYDGALAYLYDSDPATGTPVPSPELRAYRATRQAWLDADTEYHRAESAAALSSDQAVRDQWTRVDEPRLRQARDDAMDAWQTVGHKAEVDDALRESSELAAKSPSGVWKRHRDTFNPNIPGQFSTAPNGLRYAPTYYSPAAALDTPWTAVTMNRELFLTLAPGAPKEFGAALGSRASDDSFASLSFEYRVVSVLRPWLDPPMELFGSRAWRFSSGVRELSDGGAVPQGRCPSYVESIALARKVHLTREAHQYTAFGSGENNFSPMTTCEWDTGRLHVTMDIADHRWEWGGSGGTLVPGHPRTGLAALGLVDYDSLDGHALDVLPYAHSPIAGGQLSDGAVFAVRTPRRKLVKVQVVSHGPTLSIRFQEYEMTSSAAWTSDTEEDDVFIAGLVCRRLPKCPDPDGTLEW
ncbi:hypothetical protein IAG44_27785 [Streptomyces roseirectus]|uniref:Uncharacterized protein n=1 Tax=Streptomyces roseirectus TaxID=2768066 RepID=A0A7H0IJ92_9ACTN|nr:hypothetical protein [Streptomyces roseirectus]QNP72858.1 hypothetical protein IAG44_27785 [Streptomyces roseirectus]